jgi:hypothetical protein
MPTFKHVGLTLLFLGLAACADSIISSNSKAVEISVAGRAVTISAPEGYCVDVQNVQVNQTGGFVVLEDCALMGDDPDATPIENPIGALLSASVSRGPLVDGTRSKEEAFEDLAAFFRTENGRIAISKSRELDKVSIRRSEIIDDVLYVLVRDRGEKELPGESSLFWRGFLEVNQRLVTVSLNGFSGAFPGTDRSLKQLQRFARSIIEANPTNAPAQEPEPVPEPEPVEEPVEAVEEEATTEEPQAEEDEATESESDQEETAEEEEPREIVIRLPSWWPKNSDDTTKSQ